MPDNDFQILRLSDTFYDMFSKEKYPEILRKRIKRDALQFVEDYVRHMKNENLLHPSEFRRRYSYSPLKYFHEELGIS